MTNSDFLPTAEPVARLIQEFHKLPGVGSKTAQRLTYHLVRMPKAESENLAEAILAMKERTILCSQCQNISENDPCPICLDPQRDITRICVLEEPLDVLAIERTHAYKGLYHVLHGAISPINGIGPDELRISELLTQIKAGNVTEVIVATNPNLEGEATAMYLHKLISLSLIHISEPTRPY